MVTKNGLKKIIFTFVLLFLSLSSIHLFAVNGAIKEGLTNGIKRVEEYSKEVFINATEPMRVYLAARGIDLTIEKAGAKITDMVELAAIKNELKKCETFKSHLDCSKSGAASLCFLIASAVIGHGLQPLIENKIGQCISLENKAMLHEYVSDTSYRRLASVLLYAGVLQFQDVSAFGALITHWVGGPTGLAVEGIFNAFYNRFINGLHIRLDEIVKLYDTADEDNLTQAYAKFPNAAASAGIAVFAIPACIKEQFSTLQKRYKESGSLDMSYGEKIAMASMMLLKINKEIDILREIIKHEKEVNKLMHAKEDAQEAATQPQAKETIK